MQRLTRPRAPQGARGFTLIELIVVVGIIGLIGALASLLFSRVQTQDRYYRAVRRVPALINEARTMVAELGAAVEDPTVAAWLVPPGRRVTDQDGDCAALGPFNLGAMPGFSISPAGVVTLIDSIRMRVPPAPPAGALADNFRWAPVYEVDCRTENLTGEFRIPLLVLNDPTIGNGASGLDVNGANFVLRFDGRGLLANANPNGAFRIQHNIPAAQSPRVQTVVVPLAGGACLGIGDGLTPGRCVQ